MFLSLLLNLIFLSRLLPCNNEGGFLFLKGRVLVGEIFFKSTYFKILYSSDERAIDIHALYNLENLMKQGTSLNYQSIFKSLLCAEANILQLVWVFTLNLVCFQV